MNKITINTLFNMKKNREKIAMLTSYDASFTRLMNQQGVDAILIGDSLGNVIQGQKSTVPVTIEDMVYHTQNVARGNEQCFLIGDMPFMASFDKNITCQNATKLMQAGAEIVKIEGGQWLCESIQTLSQNGIPVCGHLGLRPQSVNILGGYKIQGKEEQQSQEILNDALALQEAGIKLLVLECVPSQLAEGITLALDIPVIGIGAGNKCDGQVLVVYDMLGISKKLPKFSKNFLLDVPDIPQAFKSYVQQVKQLDFPSEAETLS